MQKGIATLEIVMVIFIVGVLASCAVPNAVRVLDRVMIDSHFNKPENFQSKLTVYPERYVITKNGDDNIVYDEHEFFNGVTTSNILAIKFDDMGKPQSSSDTALNGHIIIKSRLGKILRIRFDSVGRFRGARPDE